MIIRCPYCEFTRTVTLGKIPPTAELATCPKCGQRFRFRTLPQGTETATTAEQAAEAEMRAQPKPFPAERAGLMSSGPLSEQKSAESSALSVPVGAKNSTPGALQTPGTSPPAPSSQDAETPPRFAESVGPADIWEAMDSLHKCWQREELLLSEAEQEPMHGAAGEDGSLPEPPVHPLDEPDAKIRAEAFAGTEPRQEDAPPVFRKANHKGGKVLSLEASCPPCSAGDEQCPPAPVAENTATRPFASDAADEAELSAQDKVERDLLMLKATHGPADAPVRDLGRLTDFDTPAQTLSSASSGEHADKGAPGEPAPAEASHTSRSSARGSGLAPSSVAWEEPARRGWLHSFFKTVHDAMFSGPIFFSELRPAGSPAPAYLFFMLMGYAVIAGSVVWAELALLLIPSLRATFTITKNLPVLLLTAPLALGLMLVLVAGCLRLTALLFAPDEEADFNFCFTLVSYSTAPLLLCIIPFVGPAIGSLWFLFTFIIACRQALRLSRAASLLVPLPSALLLLGGMAWYYFI